MALIRIPGRRFLDTETGKEYSRRQADKILGRIKGSYEAKAKENKKENIVESLARPARGRPKAKTEKEKEIRLEMANEKEKIKLETKAEKKAKQKSKTIRVKKIRPQLLKSGHLAERVSFLTYDQYLELVNEAKNNKLSNGRRLITAYGLGIVGVDSRNGNPIAATIMTMESPSTILDEEEFQDLSDDFLESRPYFIFSHYYMHLHFDRAYAEKRAQESRIKNVMKMYKRNSAHK